MQICLMTAVFPPAIGGPATHVFQLHQSLAADGHAVYVVALGEQPSADPRVTIIPLRAPRVRRLWQLAATLWRLRRKIDVIYAHGAPWDVGLPALIVQQLTGIPVVFKVTGDNAWERAQNVHGVRDDIETFQQRRYGWRVEVFRWLQRAIFRRMRHIIVPSPALQALVASWGVAPERVSCVPNAVSDDGPIPPWTARGTTALRVITVGRLAPWKHMEGVLEAFAGVNHGATLDIIGDGPAMHRLTDRARSLGLASRVRFYGACAHEATLAQLAQADLVVLASSYEGAPHVLLEALRAGAAIVATRIPGIAQYLTHGESGWLVPPNDPAALRDAITQLLDDPARRAQLGASARARWEQLPTWPEVVRQLTHLLNGVA